MFLTTLDYWMKLINRLKEADTVHVYWINSSHYSISLTLDPDTYWLLAIFVNSLKLDSLWSQNRLLQSYFSAVTREKRSKISALQNSDVMYRVFAISKSVKLMDISKLPGLQTTTVFHFGYWLPLEEKIHSPPHWNHTGIYCYLPCYHTYFNDKFRAKQATVGEQEQNDFYLACSSLLVKKK